MRLFGAACETELIVVQAPREPINLMIGGHEPLSDAKSRKPGLSVATPADAAPGLGKRYVDANGSLEVLCTKAAAGAITVDAVVCTVQDAKPLPASDGSGTSRMQCCVNIYPYG